MKNATMFHSVLLKKVRHHEIPALYAECDVYAQPSIVEPYGIAVLEAMACGKPVVGTRVGGILDTMKDGGLGFSLSLWIRVSWQSG